MLLRINYPSDKQKVIEYISKLPDKKYTVKIDLKREIRSLPQNKLMWLWLTCIMQETGNDKNDLHDYFKGLWLPVKQVNVLGKIIEKTVSTSELDSKQFTDYLERIQQFANTELGIVLPDPSDLHFAEFYEQYSNYI